MAVHISTTRADDDDDEWEYEYDETQTDTFYVTLDLTSHVPASYHEVKPNSVNNGPSTPAPQAFQPAGGDSTQGLGGSPAKTADSASKRLQLLDLHTSNPLVSYNDKLFTCSWATSIGTDIILSKDTPTPNNADPPDTTTSTSTRPPHTLPIARPHYTLALSSLRLIAKPLSLVPHPDTTPVPPPATPTPHPSTLTAPLPLPPPPPLASTHPANTILHDRTAQHSFLTRLAALRASHGYHVPVPLQASDADFSGVTVATPLLKMEKKRKGSVSGGVDGEAGTPARTAIAQTPMPMPPPTPAARLGAGMDDTSTPPPLGTPMLATPLQPTIATPRRMTASSRGLGSWGGNRGAARGRGSRRGRGWREKMGMGMGVGGFAGQGEGDAGSAGAQVEDVQMREGEAGGVVVDPMLEDQVPAAGVGAVSGVDGVRAAVDVAMGAAQKDGANVGTAMASEARTAAGDNDTIMRDE